MLCPNCISLPTGHHLHEVVVYQLDQIWTSTIHRRSPKATLRKNGPSISAQPSRSATDYNPSPADHRSPKMDKRAFREMDLGGVNNVYNEFITSATREVQRAAHARSRMHTKAMIKGEKMTQDKRRMRGKEYRIPIANRYSTSSVPTPSASLFSIVGVISSTWTVIRLFAATLLYAATLGRFGVSSSAPNGCLSRAMTWSARVCLSVCDIDDGGRREAASRGNVVVRSLNDRRKRATSRAAPVCGAADAIPKGPGINGNPPIEEYRSSVNFERFGGQRRMMCIY